MENLKDCSSSFDNTNVTLKDQYASTVNNHLKISSSTLNNHNPPEMIANFQKDLTNHSTISSNSTSNTIPTDTNSPTKPPPKPPRTRRKKFENNQTEDPIYESITPRGNIPSSTLDKPNQKVQNRNFSGNSNSSKVDNCVRSEHTVSAVISLDKLLADLENMQLDISDSGAFKEDSVDIPEDNSLTSFEANLQKYNESKSKDYVESTYEMVYKPNIKPKPHKTGILKNKNLIKNSKNNHTKDNSPNIYDNKPFEPDKKLIKFNDKLKEDEKNISNPNIDQNSNDNNSNTCDYCNKAIINEVLHALGKKFHPDHFFCNVCQKSINNSNFIGRDDKIYCEPCYNKYFNPTCPKCSLPVLDFCTEAMGNKWHPDCFTCKQCNRCLGDEIFMESKNDPYCEKCYNDLFAAICKRCGKSIMTKFIFALDSHWHQECFNCTTCNVSFPNGRFYEYKNLPYCEPHFYKAKGSICEACNGILKNSNYIEALGKKYHVKHFICAYCLKMLKTDCFKEKGSKLYHRECYNINFGI